MTHCSLSGQQQTLTLVRPHSKAVLQEAIKSDADFLAKSNIMDYSYVESTVLKSSLHLIFLQPPRRSR